MIVVSDQFDFVEAPFRLSQTMIVETHMPQNILLSEFDDS